MESLGLVDGLIVDIDQDVISMEDRGYQFGDGVYEVVRVYNGRCFTLEMHTNRLYRSLRELRIPVVYTHDELAEFHERLIRESGITEGMIYLQITRGTSPRTHQFPEKIIPKLTMTIRSVNLANAENRENGVKVITIPDERWLRCDIKSLNLLANVLGKQKAKEAGCFEGIMIRDEYITEGTASNFFLVKDGLLWTYPSSNLILTGITRTIITEKLKEKLDLMIVEKPFTAQFAKTADELFITGTGIEIVPVISVDGVKIQDGKVGEMTRKIQSAYAQLIRQECQIS